MSEYIAKRIRELRLEKGYTQAQLAEMLGYTAKSSIAKIEAGKVDLPQSKIKALAEALGTTPSDILGPTERDDVNVRIQMMHENPRLGVLFDKSSKMSSKDLDAVMNIVDAILRERDND